MTNQPNVSWPGWEVVRLIGRGSFGAVYEIQRTLFDDVEKAALKVISIPQDDGDIEELYNEGYDEESITSTFHSHMKSVVGEYSLMRRMNGSANIVNCDDVTYIPHADGFGWDIYIKMELLTPLLKSLPAGDVPDETVIRVAHDLCQALVLCKKHEIVHRDIKPQNIFLSPNGDYKLGDFGIAKTVEKTMGGTKIGTYKYMAPEVYNNQPYGSGADIYSLGLVLYQLLNERRLPFMPLPPEKPRAGQEEAARLRRFGGERLPAPAHGSEELKAIVLKACAYDPKERYASAEEMLAALDELRYGRQFAAAVPQPAASPAPAPEAKVEVAAAPQATVLPSEKKNMTAAQPERNTGFSSADEMLEALGMDSQHEKEKVSEAIGLGIANERKEKSSTAHIRFLIDGRVAREKEYAIGEKIVVPNLAERIYRDGQLYMFAGWTPVVPRLAAEDADFEAVYESEPELTETDAAAMPVESKFAARIRFLIDGKVAREKVYTVGEKISVPLPPEEIYREGEAHVFVGWTPVVPRLAAEDADFEAVYRPVKETKKRMYDARTAVRIRFEVDGKTVQDRSYAIGEKLDVPVPPATTFAGDRLWSFAYWEPEVPETAAVNAEFRAIYVAGEELESPALPEEKPAVRIRFIVDDQVASAKTYAIGDRVTAPVPPATTFAGGKLWSFAYWEPAVPEIASEDAEFRAIYVLKKDETSGPSPKKGFLSLLK